MTKTCIQCCISYQVDRSHFEKSKWCSRKCRGQNENITLNRACQFCNRIFSFPEKREKTAHFCSRECSNKYRDKKIEITCKVCGKVLKVKRNRINPTFCSSTCFYQSRKGKILTFMNDPESKARGVAKMRDSKTIFSPENPTFNSHQYPGFFINGKFILMHRYVVEKAIGRPLTKTETIHHINENIKDYSLENLYIFPNKGKHCGYHHLVKRGKCVPIVESNVHNFM